MSVELNPHHPLNQTIKNILTTLGITDVISETVWITGGKKYPYIKLTSAEYPLDLRRCKAVAEILASMIESYNGNEKAYIDNKQAAYPDNFFVELNDEVKSKGEELKDLAESVSYSPGFANFQKCLDLSCELPVERKYLAKTDHYAAIKPVLKGDNFSITYGFVLTTDDPRLIKEAAARPQLATQGSTISGVKDISSHNGANEQMLELFNKIREFASSRPLAEKGRA